ncbi:hypothetical protein FZC33_16020 [Labrys sp. KNU-23]|uniref:hypothetical protein n=1 Tax=Labrys sp. KNU-23 TaxID=2789216 RepID=UPI0011EDEF7E|nr:hypothetical protein [Labrys sp. KNU-23]QEN87730.1 hypothetical protein FZC33_16020 [Labrys sp. KNU-23]
MPRASSKFTQAAIERAARGVKRAGLDIRRVEVDQSGKIVIFTGADDASQPADDADAALDQWQAKNARST